MKPRWRFVVCGSNFNGSCGESGTYNPEAEDCPEIEQVHPKSGNHPVMEEPSGYTIRNISPDQRSSGRSSVSSGSCPEKQRPDDEAEARFQSVRGAA
jgi:hypothetical protein